MDKLSWKDKMSLVLEGVGQSLKHIGLPVLVIIVLLHILFHTH